jgi:hypothetical protein
MPGEDYPQNDLVQENPTPEMKGGKRILDSRKFWAVASLSVISYVALFDLRIITASDTLQVQYTPDDAYYYLGLARNFVRLGFWTFDSGVSTASGFHPLLAYILSLLYGVFRPTTGEFVRYGLALTSLTTLATALGIWLLGVRRSLPYSMMFLTLLISSTNFIYNSVSVMEWPLVVLLAFLYCFCYYRTYSSIKKRDWVMLLILGLMGSLARSDFGLLPFSFFVANLILYYVGKNKAAILSSLTGLAGATLGVLLVFAHIQFFTGNFLQSSVKMKAYWAMVYGDKYPSAIGLIFNVLNIAPPSLWLFGGILALLGTLVLFLFVRSSSKKQGAFKVFGLVLGGTQSLRVLTMAVAAGLCIVGDVFTYAHSGTIQPWYTANFLAPVFILLVFLAEYIDSRMWNSLRPFARLVLQRHFVLLRHFNKYTHWRDLMKGDRHEQTYFALGSTVPEQTPSQWLPSNGSVDTI